MLRDFLKTTRSEEELEAALEVYRDFRESEGYAESKANGELAWAMADVFEELLAYLVEAQPISEQTQTQLQLPLF